jgi:hypothetical protein
MKDRKNRTGSDVCQLQSGKFPPCATAPTSVRGRFPETFKHHAVRYGMSVELAPVIRPVSGRNVNKNDMVIFRQLFRKVSCNLQEGFLTFRKVPCNLQEGFLMFRTVSCNLQEGFLMFRKVPRNLQEGFLMFRTASCNLQEGFLTFRTASSPARACSPRRQIPQSAKRRNGFAERFLSRMASFPRCSGKIPIGIGYSSLYKE